MAADQSPGLFDAQAPRPLADLLRPTTLADVVGQDHLLEPSGPIGRMLAEDKIASMILWGPPGSGKTTIARLLADATALHFEPLSAVFSGVSDLRLVFDQARARRIAGQGTLLFVDEIHRFNRAQQDGFLPYVENGTVTLIGATTENPSFELNSALLSRCQIFALVRLDHQGLEKLLVRAEAEAGCALPVDDQARAALCEMADGDGRYVLNLAEAVLGVPAVEPLDTAALAALVRRRAPLYDKSQDGHFNLISALHKAIRGSDVDAALYWFARMLEGGEDPRYIARRLTRIAVEDIGLADPGALVQALAGWQSYERLGSPEGELAIAHTVVYLAGSAKSNALYKAFGAACEAAERTGSLMPPAHILNAPTALMKDLGYGAGYIYDHDTPEGFSGENFFPDELPPETYFHPSGRGYEAELADRLKAWVQRRKAPR